jgi:hypothetical protein
LVGRLRLKAGGGVGGRRRLVVVFEVEAAFLFGVAEGQAVISVDFLGAAEFLAVGGIVAGRLSVAHPGYL